MIRPLAVFGVFLITGNTEHYCLYDCLAAGHCRSKFKLTFCFFFNVKFEFFIFKCIFIICIKLIRLRVVDNLSKMSNQRICKYYLQGNCMYGTSCRFLHSENRQNRANDQYYDEYQPRNNRRGGGGGGSYYNQGTRHNRRDGGGDDYYDKEEDSYNYPKKYDDVSHGQNYNNKKHYYQKNDYDKNYIKNNEYDSQSNFSQRNNRRSDREYDMNINQNHNNRRNIASNKYNENQNEYSQINKFNNTRDSLTQNGNDQRQAMLKFYETEINNYQSHMKQLLSLSVWPFTCSHPIGHTYPIQPIGILNLVEVSYEEIRCDHYLAKILNPDAVLIHKQLYDKLLHKARCQKEEIISLGERVLNDMLATLEKCKTIKNNPSYQDIIQMDPNSYWNMTIQFLSSHDANSILSNINTQSFNNAAPANEQKKKAVKPQTQILMQTEVYGKMDCNEFTQNEFVDFIPIMPPPQKYCL
ncbi:GATA zinc finger domain-containing protein 15-like [Adelges cooleyi]|uniref:GATA zinc finger domain-containing protein 15-like n=1 Tax=Adelges cooleyi TaxID=133065 RepID=UPI00217F5360|nr:GATA zinc finger domain-containing protein 15-like [Adelges cooleyi]